MVTGKKQVKSREKPGKKQVNKKAPQRNAKGQYLPGFGGPGKKKEVVDEDFDLLVELEDVIAKGMRSKDLGDRLKAAALAFKFEGIKKPDENPMSDFDLAFLKLITNLAAYNLTSGTELMGRMLEVCPGCERLKSANEEDIKDHES